MRLSLSIHSYIIILVIGTVLPFLVFSALLVDHAATGEQELIARNVRNAADGAAGDINRQITTLQSLALALADTRALQTDDLPAFNDQASDLVRRQDLTVVLHDPSGQQLVNTSVPFGTTLPADPAAVRSAVENGVAEFSDLVMDPVTGRMIVNVAVPVLHRGALVYVLTMQISNAIAAVMTAQLVVPELNIGLVDRLGTIIYRARDPQLAIGLKAPNDFLTGIAGRDAGEFTSATRAGVPAYIAFSRVKLAGWVLGVSIPRRVLFAPVHDSQLRMLLLAAGALLTAALVACLVGRAIIRPVAGLLHLAAALGAHRQIVQPPATRLREVNAVADSMIAETQQLREQTEQHARAAEALRVETANRWRIEQQLVQSQKMEAVGQLTGGLAHDFNNLLAIVIGNLDMLRERWNGDCDSNELIGGALEAALRGADLTKQLLAFARRQPLAPEQCDINRVIRTMVRLLRRSLGEDVVISLRLAPDLWPVLVDRAQFGSAITNLATNARDAMPHGGRLTITTRSTQLDDDYAALHAEVTPGDYVLIEVSDTGSGMSLEVLERIFEPFFTTKAPGRDTGLGLSMVFGFIKQSGGHITAYSELGAGTTFRLYLPPAPDFVEIAEPMAPVAPSGRNETILAVEDNAGLRQTLVRQLSSAGYRVLQASDARTALDTIDSGEMIDLLLSDIVMPGGMNGQELAQAAALRRPMLKVLLTTGFSDVSSGNPASALRILRKPYRKEELLRTVREALDA